MRVLLDENLPHKLREELVGHDIQTAAYARLSGVRNGLLLRRAAELGFTVLITNDRGIEYEQNQSSLPLSVVILLVASNTIETIRPLLPAIQMTLETLPERTLVRVSRP